MSHKYNLESGSSRQGYLIFMKKFPLNGEALLYIPIFETNDALIHNFEFTYTFSVE